MTKLRVHIFRLCVIVYMDSIGDLMSDEIDDNVYTCSDLNKALLQLDVLLVGDVSKAAYATFRLVEKYALELQVKLMKSEIERKHLQSLRESHSSTINKLLEEVFHCQSENDSLQETIEEFRNFPPFPFPATNGVE